MQTFCPSLRSPAQLFPALADIRAFMLVSLALLLLSTLFSNTAFAGTPTNVGDQAPDWILTNSQGETVSFYQDSDGKKAVLIFWATWCPYCAALLPEMEKLRAENPDVKFYALNIWEDSDPLKYMREKEYGFSVMLNADKVAKRYSVQGTPGLFVIDEAKTIRYIRTKGAEPKDVYAAVKQALTVD